MSGPGWLLGSLMVLVGVAILASIIYSFLRVTRTPEQSGLGIIRAMLALVLVGGLVILAGASFSMGDTQTRNLLVGGLVASSAAAVAFYFASRDADNARRDLLNATLGTENVPKLEGLKVSQAQAAMSSGSLVLKLPEPVPAVTHGQPRCLADNQNRSSTAVLAVISSTDRIWHARGQLGVVRPWTPRRRPSRFTARSP